jgi:hypothetical protein
MADTVKQAINYKLVSWPTPQDYNEALQNPKLSFSDPELAAGKPALTPLGLPKPMTGAFASVYRMHCKNRDWAVRCFLRNFPDQHDRYNKIEEHIIAAKLPFTVGFDYVEDGLLLQGTRYPILKMEWAEGQHLDQFIAHNLHNPKLIGETAEAWKEMLGKLREGGIAHGDLQHGNVLVDNKNFELVDYDGMYVPALAGMESNELGHRNYQHPGRTKDHFGLYLDNFPGWLIYVCLKILSIDPSLWRDLQGGDECLLFRQQDLKDPMHSVTFSFLEHHKSPEVQRLSRLIRSFLSQKVENIPNLDANPADPKILPAIPKWTDLLAENAEAHPITGGFNNNFPSWMTNAPTSQNSQPGSYQTNSANTSKRATWPPPKGTFGQSQGQPAQASAPPTKSKMNPILSQFLQTAPPSKQATWPPPKSGYVHPSQRTISSSIQAFMKYWNLGPVDIALALILAIIWIPMTLLTLFHYLSNELAPLLTAMGWDWSWPLWMYAFAAIPIALYYAIRYWPSMGSQTSGQQATPLQTKLLSFLVVALTLVLAIFIAATAQFNTSMKNTTDIVVETENEIKTHNDAVAEQSLSIAKQIETTGNYSDAIQLYKQALSKYVANYKFDPNAYFPQITKTLNTIGECYQRAGNKKMASKYLNKSTELVRLFDSGNLAEKDLFILPNLFSLP